VAPVEFLFDCVVRPEPGPGSVALKLVMHPLPTITGRYSPIMTPPPPVLSKGFTSSAQLS
jgi:hypothetical protein